MKLEGVVGACELADIFHLLSSTTRCGVLVVSKGEARRKLYFGPEGVTLFWDSQRASHLLGQILLARGVVSEKVLRVCLEKQGATGLPLGQILCNVGACRPEHVEEALAYQLREELYHVLSWEKAHFKFHEGASHPVDPGRSYSRTPSFNTDAIIMEAARRADEWQRIREVITSEHAVPLRSAPDVALTGELTRNDVVPAVFGLADGTHTVQQMVETLRRSEFDVYETVYALLGADIVKLAGARELVDLAETALASARTAPARRLLANAAALCGDDLTLRYDIGTMLLYAGDEESARANLDVVLRHLVDQGLTTKIEEMLDSLRDEFPDVPYSYERRLKLLNRSKDFVRALPLAVRLLELYARRGDLRTAACMLRHLSGFTVRRTRDLLQLAQMLEPHDSRAAARKYCLAADQLRYDGQRREAIRLYRKALSLDDQLGTARRELDCLVTRAGRRLTRLALSAAVLVVGVAAGAAGFFLLQREHAATRALREVQDVATVLLSKNEFDGALEAYRDVIDAHPHTLAAGDAREHVVRIEARRREHLRDRRDQEHQLFVAAEQAERQLDLDRAVAGYRQLAAGSLTDGLSARAEERLRDLLAEKEGYQRLLDTARSQEAARDYTEAARSYLAAREHSARLFDHDQVKLPVLVESDPPGARILRDGKTLGTTPLLIHLLTDESCDLVLRHQGFYDTPATFTPGDAEKSRPVRLIRTRQPLWTFHGKGTIDQSPQVLDAVCYVSDRHGRLYALSLHDGSPIWEVRLGTLPGEYLSAPVVAGDRVIVSTMDGSLVAFARATGSQLWRRSGHGLLAGPPIHLASERQVVLVHPDGTAHCADPVNGETVRQLRLPRAVLGAMLTVGDTLYYGTDDHALQAFDLKQGRAGWKWRPGRPVTQPLKHSGNILCVPLQDHGLAAVPLSSGERLWRFGGQGESITTAAANDAHVFVVDQNSQLTALNVRTGTVAWRVRLSGGTVTELQADNRQLYLGMSEGTFCVRNALDGSLLWKTDLDGPAASPPVLAGDMVLVTTTTGAVHAFRR